MSNKTSPRQRRKLLQAVFYSQHMNTVFHGPSSHTEKYAIAAWRYFCQPTGRIPPKEERNLLAYRLLKSLHVPLNALKGPGLSAEAKAARAPLKPYELVDALNDCVHRDPGAGRAARLINRRS